MLSLHTSPVATCTFDDLPYALHTLLAFTGPGCDGQEVTRCDYVLPEPPGTAAGLALVVYVSSITAYDREAITSHPGVTRFPSGPDTITGYRRRRPDALCHYPQGRLSAGWDAFSPHRSTHNLALLPGPTT